jgi:hypothetical protein
MSLAKKASSGLPRIRTMLRAPLDGYGKSILLVSCLRADSHLHAPALSLLIQLFLTSLPSAHDFPLWHIICPYDHHDRVDTSFSCFLAYAHTSRDGKSWPFPATMAFVFLSSRMIILCVLEQLRPGVWASRDIFLYFCSFSYISCVYTHCGCKGRHTYKGAPSGLLLLGFSLSSICERTGAISWRRIFSKKYCFDPSFGDLFSWG